MNTLMKTILPFCLVMASTVFAPAIAADDVEAREPSASEKPVETWPSSVKTEGPAPGTCASFLDPGMRLIDRKDSDDATEKSKEEKKDDGKKQEKEEKKKKKQRANAYTNPESTSCMV